MSSSFFTDPVVILPSTLITTGISVTFMFHNFISSPAKSRFLSLFLVSFSLDGLGRLRKRQSQLVGISLFCFVGHHLVGRLAEIKCLFASQNPRELCASHSPGRTLVCAYTIFSYGKITISCKILCVLSYILFALIYRHRLLYDRSFRLYHRIMYTCYFVASYLVLLLHS